MSRSRSPLPSWAGTLLAALVLVVAVLPASPAAASVTVSRAEVDRGNLRIEGRAVVSRTITVDGVAMATSDSSGSFRISRSGYTPPADCTVDVNDGSAVATTVRLSGCTVSSTPPPAGMLPDAAELGPFRVGVQLGTTVVNMTGAIGPTSWTITAGALPAGLSLVVPEPAGRPSPPENQTYAEIRGTPTAVQTTTVTFRATDANGLTATRTYTVRVDPAPALEISPQSWPPAVVGEPVNLWFTGSGGLLPYRWAVTAGALPPGTSLIQDDPDGPLVRIGGTPTTEGSFGWTLTLSDAQAGSTSRAFTVTVGPAPAPAPAPAPEPTPEPQPTPAPVSLSSLSLSPTSVTGGTTSTGTVTVSAAAPSGGMSIILASGNPQVATVPSTVLVPAGATSATFPVTTSAVTTSTTVGIEASWSGTLVQNLTVTPPAGTSADTVSVTRAEYDSGKRQLRVEATSSGTGATLRVHVTSTGALIGTLSGGSGPFSLSVNPQSVTVRSSLGGSATRTVTAK